MFKEFRDFAMRGNVVDLAVGIIIGAAFTGIVNSLVKDIIMPPIGFIMGGIDFSNYFITLKGDNYGVFFNTVINFLIVAFAIFMLVKQINRFKKEEAAAPAAPNPQEVLLGEIRDLLKERR